MSVKSGLPAAVDVGLIELNVGTGLNVVSYRERLRVRGAAARCWVHDGDRGGSCGFTSADVIVAVTCVLET